MDVQNTVRTGLQVLDLNLQLTGCTRKVSTRVLQKWKRVPPINFQVFGDEDPFFAPDKEYPSGADLYVSAVALPGVYFFSGLQAEVDQYNSSVRAQKVLREKSFADLRFSLGHVGLFAREASVLLAESTSSGAERIRENPILLPAQLPITQEELQVVAHESHSRSADQEAAMVTNGKLATPGSQLQGPTFFCLQWDDSASEFSLEMITADAAESFTDPVVLLPNYNAMQTGKEREVACFPQLRPLVESGRYGELRAVLRDTPLREKTKQKVFGYLKSIESSKTKQTIRQKNIERLKKVFTV